MMPVKGNDEAGGVLSRRTTNCFAGIPLKKRRFPEFPPLSPPSQEPQVKEPNVVEPDVSNNVVEPDVSNNVVEPDVSNNVVEEVKKESPIDLSGSGPPDNIVTVTDDTPQVKLPLLAEKPAATASLSLIVKNQIIMNQSQGYFEHQLSSGLGNVAELSLGSKEKLLFVPGEHKQSEGSSRLPDELDPSLLTLSLSGDKNPITETASSVPVGANRSNWDLNMTMDAWESSAVGIDDASISYGDTDTVVKPCSTVVKGKQLVDPFEKISKLCISSEESLHLSLGTFSPAANLSLPQAGCSRIITSESNLQKLTTNITSGSRIVKPEPVDESLRLNSIPFNSNSTGSLESILVKTEIVDKNKVEAIKMSSSNPHKLVEPRSVKSEVAQEVCTSNVIICRSNQRQESCSSSSTNISMPLTPQQPDSSIIPNCPKLSAGGGCVRNHTREDRKIEGPELVNHIGIEPNASEGGNVNSGLSGDLNVEDSEMSRLERRNELGSIAEGSVRDTGKINISDNTNMLEEDACGSDYEPGGDHCLSSQVDIEGEHCEYEDGEFRESLIRSSVEDPTSEVMETPNVTEMANPVSSYPCDSSPEQYNAHEKQIEVEILDETNSDRTRESTKGNTDQLIEDEFSMPKSLPEKVTTVGADERRPENAPLEQSGEKDVIEKASRKELSGDDATTPVNYDVTGEIVQGNNAVGNAESSLTKAEECSLDVHDAGKDSVTGGNRSRIIHLPRASNFTSPSRIRSIPGRQLSSRGGRERYSDLRGNRDDIYADIPNKFSRDRIHNQSYRNSRGFMRGRGRGVSGRVGTFHGEWDPDHDFSSRNFDGSVGYQFGRYKRASAITDECNDFVVAPDETAMGANRGERKPFSEETYSFRHSSSRRISPDARDVPVTRNNNQLLHRLQRNTAGDAAGHEKKFIRSLPDDMTDSVYTRPQAGYEELDGQFIQGNRKFSTPQRRGFPRVRSKSPVNNRSRSPRPWISPRRRLPDGFNHNLSDQSQHRSPATYRMRSPGRGCYTEDMGTRRHVSPNYVARPSNDMNSGRGRGRIRSVNSGGRSPSDRVFPRSSRRLDVVDHRKSSRGDDYFDGAPIHAPGRFHEFRGDGSNRDERKKFGERRSPVLSFRPTTYNGNNNDGYCLNSDDGGSSRPLRFCQDQDKEVFERDFDGVIKNRPLIAQRRQIRNIEEQEGNYRQTGGQIWHDDAFGDDSRLKRRRF